MNMNRFLSRRISIESVQYSVLAVIIVFLAILFVVAGLYSGHDWRSYPFMWSAMATGATEIYIATRLIGSRKTAERSDHEKVIKALLVSLFVIGILLCIWAPFTLLPCR